MFVHIRYQTGELKEVLDEMEKGSIPCMDVDDMQEYNWVISRLAQQGMFRIKDMEPDKNARDRIREPEFEFRASFFTKSSKLDELDKKDIMYIDFYFEPIEDDTYDPIGEM